MAVTYFQDTIFFTDTTLSAPGDGTVLQVASNNFFATKSYTLTVTVADIDTNVVVRLDGSIDGTNYAPIIAAQTITANGTSVYSVADRPVKFVKAVFVSESGGDNSATVLFNLAAVTVASVGVPADKELPNTIIKSITSPVDRLDANVSVEPLTVKLSVGAWIVPFKLTKN